MSNAKMAQIAKDKSLLKEYTGTNNSRVVYLNDKDEFQIQLYNPYSYTIAARITLNGNVMDNKLVIRPAERIWLDRYLDKAVKFKFETYEVDGDKETEKIIANNGVVRVDFYKEKPRKKNPIQIITTSSQPSWGCYGSGERALGSSIYTNVSSVLDAGIRGTKGDPGDPGDPGVLGASSYATCDVLTSSCYNSASEVASLSSAKLSMADTVETGRIAEGSYSSQKFDDVDMDFESWTCASETVKILPMSRKPITANDLAKQYCPNCGHKINDRYRFCPYCGESLKD